MTGDLESISNEVNYEPKKIEQLNERLSLGYKLLKKHGVKTTVKLSSVEKDTPTSEANLDGIEERIIIDASNITHSLRVKAHIIERMKKGEELIFVDAVIKFGKNDTIMDKVLKIYDKQNSESESFIKSV